MSCPYSLVFSFCIQNKMAKGNVSLIASLKYYSQYFIMTLASLDVNYKVQFVKLFIHIVQPQHAYKNNHTFF